MKTNYSSAHTNMNLTVTLHSYLTWTDAQFYPWEGRTQCCQAEQPGFPGSWWSKPSRRCSHHQTSSGILSCCGWMCCWSPLCHLSTWTHQCLPKEYNKNTISPWHDYTWWSWESEMTKLISHLCWRSKYRWKYSYGRRSPQISHHQSSSCERLSQWRWRTLASYW